MDAAIKEIIVPFLREQAFKGSYPHFRRLREDRINLLTFQFSTSGPKFVVEISNCSSKGIQRGWGPNVKPSACTAHDMNIRHRLGQEKFGGDNWFDFSKESFFANIYQKRAKDVIALWSEAEKWWLEDPYDQRLALQPD